MKIFEHPDGTTPLDPNEVEGLKLKHITTREELDRWEQENISEAMRWLERRHNKTDILNNDFIQNLHRKMFSKVWLWAGQLRRSDKNIGVKWTVVPIELKTMLEDIRFWIDNATYPPNEIAVRFHHRLVLIHLFPNGNGRHSRLITDTLLKDVLNQKAFSWGSDNLSIIADLRIRYITALKAADNGDYSLLTEFVKS
jgi:Fic-DOC domain mobile mystery protein B